MDNQTSIEAALSLMDAHIEALNKHDEIALANTLHFPHIRLSGTCLKIWQTSESYFTDFKQRAGDGWSHSTFNDIQIVASAADKVHLDAEILRFRADGSILTRFRSLWVITCEASHWAAKMRSSFANQ